VETGKQIRSFKGDRGRWSWVTVSPEGRLLAACDFGSVHVWRSSTGEQVWKTIDVVPGLTSFAEFAPDCKMLTWGSRGLPAIKSWKYPQFDPLLPLNTEKAASCLSSDPSTNRLYVGTWDSPVLGFDLRTRQRISETGSAYGWPVALASSSDGKLMAVAYDRGPLRVFPVDSRRELYTFSPKLGLSSVSFIGNSHAILSNGEGKDLVLHRPRVLP
jgi:WD40 repeat protein